MSLVVPQIIGWPGAVSGKVTDNADSGTEMADHIIRTMNLAYIRPCIMSGGAGTEIWEAVPAMDLYKDYLNKGAGVTNIEKFSKKYGEMVIISCGFHCSPTGIYNHDIMHIGDVFC